MKREPAITPKHLRYIYSIAQKCGNNINLFHANLLIGAFFFAMRSCEYSRVESRGLTQLLQIQDISFFDDNLGKIETETLSTCKPAFVTIIFQQQKNSNKGESRTQQATNDPVMCPVVAWKYIVLQITSDKTLPSTTTVNTIPPLSPSKIYKFISQQDTNKLLRSSCETMPVNYFGYSSKLIGSHSIRSGAAMALFLSGESVHRIMIVGRWSSDAFLLYIRPQVQEWTSGLSQNMIKHNTFHHHSNALPSKHNRQNPDDPLTRHNPASLLSLTDTPSFHGPKSVKFTGPQLHIFH